MCIMACYSREPQERPCKLPKPDLWRRLEQRRLQGQRLHLQHSVDNLGHVINPQIVQHAIRGHDNDVLALQLNGVGVCVFCCADALKIVHISQLQWCIELMLLGLQMLPRHVGIMGQQQRQEHGPKGQCA